MTYDIDLAADFVLALMHLDVHDVDRAWKGYPWDVLDRLFERGLITDPRGRARSVALSRDGLLEAKRQFEALLAMSDRSSHEATRPKTKSTLPDVQRVVADQLLTPLCEPHADPTVNAKLRIGFRFEANAVILFESRPHFRHPSEWQEEPVAKFKFHKSNQRWLLYCMLRDLKWHEYEPLPEADELATLVAEVRADPTGIFWG
ncbi:MAG TPA: DUF6429 family protein [Gemmatimonadaceae bacterium]|nr:DUF6429 family protein [Gemmatimonadaceae bacterium]